MAYNPTKTREWKDGATPATGTPALGSLFNAEFDQLYENDNNLQGDVINEDTPGAGVTVDGVLLKDNQVTTDVINTDVINEDTPGAGVTVDGVLLKDNAITKAGGLGISEVNGAILRTKIIEIGDWNMDIDEWKYVTHGLNYLKIRTVNVMICQDSNISLKPLESPLDDPGYDMIRIEGVTIRLGRKFGGFFDTVDYNSTSFNRGWVTIQYVD